MIPAGIADDIAAEAIDMTAFEDFVTEKVMEGRSILGLYPPTDPQSRVEFEAWRANRQINSDQHESIPKAKMIKT